MNDLIEWLKNHKKVTLIIIVIAALIIIIPPIIIKILYNIGSTKTNTPFSADNLLLYSGSVLAFLGTVALGALALWLNDKANKTNDRLLKIEEDKVTPAIDFNVFEIKYESEPVGNIMQFNVHPRTDPHNFLLTNIGDIYIHSIELISIKILQYNENGEPITKVNVIDASNLHLYNTHISPRDVKIASFIYSDDEFVSFKNENSDCRLYELVFRLKTINGRSYRQNITFTHGKLVVAIPHSPHIEEISSIINKEINVEEETINA